MRLPKKMRALRACYRVFIKFPEARSNRNSEAVYDVILLTGFLHHFDPAAIGKLLRKVHAALAQNGRVVTLEFIPNEDRVSPPESASFSMNMLGATPAGDAYPFSELKRMFEDAGFSSNELRRLPGPESVIVSRK